MRCRVWKLLEKRTCKLLSLWAKLCKKDFKLSMPGSKTFVWKVKNSVHIKNKKFRVNVCPVSLYLENLGYHWNLLPTLMLDIPCHGSSCTHMSRNWTWCVLSVITIISCQVFNNCNQQSDIYWSLILGRCRVGDTCHILHVRKVASCLRDRINKHGTRHPWFSLLF